jgi:hypothetical protein
MAATMRSVISRRTPAADSFPREDSIAGLVFVLAPTIQSNPREIYGSNVVELLKPFQRHVYIYMILYGGKRGEKHNAPTITYLHRYSY